MNSWISDGRISPPNLRSYGLYVEKESVNSNFFLLNSMLFKRAYRYCKKPAIRFSSRIFSLSLVARQKIVLINDPVKLTWSQRSRLLPSSFEKNNKIFNTTIKNKKTEGLIPGTDDKIPRWQKSKMKTNNEGTEEETEMTTAMAITECSVYIVHTQALKEYAELWQNVLTQRKMN